MENRINEASREKIMSAYKDNFKLGFSESAVCESIKMYHRGFCDGMNFAMLVLGHGITTDGYGEIVVQDLYNTDEYELSADEIKFSSTINAAENWSFSEERIKKYIEVCRKCDSGDFDGASNIFGADGEPLPKRIVDLQSTKGIKAYICERLEDCNFHSEACLIEGCCYGGVFRLWGIE